MRHLRHQRSRPQPGRGPAVLYRGAGLREEDGGSARRGPLAHGRLARRSGWLRVAARTRRTPRGQTVALVNDGIPYTSFAVEDVHAEFERLRGLGVRFTQEPVQMDTVTTAVFDDTCGNLIQIASGSATA